MMVTGTGIAIASATISPMESRGAHLPNDWRYWRNWASWPVASRDSPRPSATRTPGAATTSAASRMAAAPATFFIEEREGRVLPDAGGNFECDRLCRAVRVRTRFPGRHVERIAVLTERQAVLDGEVVLVELDEHGDHRDGTAHDVRLEVSEELESLLVARQL